MTNQKLDLLSEVLINSLSHGRSSTSWKACQNAPKTRETVLMILTVYLVIGVRSESRRSNTQSSTGNSFSARETVNKCQ